MQGTYLRGSIIVELCRDLKMEPEEAPNGS